MLQNTPIGLLQTPNSASFKVWRFVAKVGALSRELVGAGIVQASPTNKWNGGVELAFVCSDDPHPQLLIRRRSNNDGKLSLPTRKTIYIYIYIYSVAQPTAYNNSGRVEEPVAVLHDSSSCVAYISFSTVELETNNSTHSRIRKLCTKLQRLRVVSTHRKHKSRPEGITCNSS